jgi:hypothetical protein
MGRTVVDASFPYPLIWDSGELAIRVEDKTFHVRFERQHWQDTDQGPPSGPRIIATNLELPYDRLGRIAHTTVEIQFPMSGEFAPGTVNDQELVRWVHAVINRLLSVYRHSTGEFHVNTVPLRELGFNRVRTINDDGTSQERRIGLSQAITGWLTVTRTQPVPEEARRILCEGTDLPIPNFLYLNAKREELFENYRIAVVEAETAFEALVDQAIAQYYRRQGLTTAQIENKLRASLIDLLGHHIRRC